MSQPRPDWRDLYVDFDNTLNIQGPWRGFYEHFPPRPGAREFLEALVKRGYKVIIFTARPDIPETWQWLIDHDMAQFCETVTNVKKPGVNYIDDRAIRFRGNYDETLQELDDFEPLGAIDVPATENPPPTEG
jgi:hypothetical protein